MEGVPRYLTNQLIYEAFSRMDRSYHGLNLGPWGVGTGMYPASCCSEPQYMYLLHWLV